MENRINIYLEYIPSTLNRMTDCDLLFVKLAQNHNLTCLAENERWENC